jgi:hypothetical protein
MIQTTPPDRSTWPVIPAGQLWIGMSWDLFEPTHPIPAVVWRCGIEGCRWTSGVVHRDLDPALRSAETHLRGMHPGIDADDAIQLAAARS